MEERKTVWVPSALYFFLFGFMYYMVSPFFTMVYLAEIPLINAAEQYMSIAYFDVYYWADSFVIFTSFILGYFLSLSVFKSRALKIDVVAYFNKASFSLVLLFTGLFVLILKKTMAMGAPLFSGYESYNIAVLGPIATYVFLMALFYNFFELKKIKFLFFILYLISSVVLLGYGSRMFFLLGTIAIFLGVISNNPRLIRNPLMYVIPFILLLLLLFIGVWRSGYDLGDFSMLMAILFVEPLFTSTSGALYFSNLDGRPFFGVPVDVVASIVNFIPSYIFPDKLEYMNAFTFDENKFSPFGANALLVNLYSNYGVFYAVYIFIVGLFYGYLRVMSVSSSLFRAVYLSLLPVLMFHFYREGFITFLKVLLFNGFVTPFIIILLLYYFFKKK